MISKILNSKIFTYILLACTVATIILTFKMRTEWWMFIDIFFLFMAVFSHLMAQSIRKLIPASAKTLDKIALVIFILFIIALITETTLILL